MNLTRQARPFTIEQYVGAGCRQFVRDGLPDLVGLALHEEAKRCGISINEVRRRRAAVQGDGA